MEQCPICKSAIEKKAVIPSEEVTGHFIDALHPTDICSDCFLKLKILSSRDDSYDAQEILEAKKYFNKCLPHIDDINMAAVLDLYVNFEDKHIDDAIVRMAYDTYRGNIKTCTKHYNSLDSVITPCGAFALDGGRFIFTTFLDMENDSDDFKEKVNSNFTEALSSFDGSMNENILEYAISKIKKEVVSDGFETHTIDVNLIECFEVGENSIFLKTMAGDFSFPIVCLPAFEELIPEKEEGFYDKMVEEYDLENDLEDLGQEIECESDSEIIQESVLRNPIEENTSDVYVMPQFADENLVRIKQLKELYDIGAITEAEYLKKKNQLLSLL